VAQGNGLTRGDRNRNRRMEALRAVVRRDHAVLAVDLGEDKQVAVVMDHECRVLARKTVTAKAHQLGGLLGWAAERAAKAGFAGLVVACEPTGHRWKALMGLADAAGHGFVCVQSMAVHRARETDDYTLGKTGQLGLTELAGSIDGVSALPAAVILAESGEPRRFASGRALVKHAGLNPSEHASATMTGQARISRRGRPGLRAAAWRATWAALRSNAVLQAKYAHLTGRDESRLAGGQARVACAAALLRWLWAVITTGQAWDPRIAAGESAPRPVMAAAA